LHVLAGAEGAAGAGEDADLEFIAVAELGPGRRELRAHVVGQRVEALGAGHTDAENPAVAFGFHDGHGGTPWVGGRVAEPGGAEEAGVVARVEIFEYPSLHIGIFRRGSVMPLYIKDDATAELVAELARKRGVSKQEAVRQAVHAELRRMTEAVPLRERIAAW